MYNYVDSLKNFLKKHIKQFLLSFVLFICGNFLIRFLIKYLFDVNIYCSRTGRTENFCSIFSQSELWNFSIFIIVLSFILLCLSIFFYLLKTGTSLRSAIISIPIIAIAIFEAQKYVYAW